MHQSRLPLLRPSTSGWRSLGCRSCWPSTSPGLGGNLKSPSPSPSSHPLLVVVCSLVLLPFPTFPSLPFPSFPCPSPAFLPCLSAPRKRIEPSPLLLLLFSLLVQCGVSPYRSNAAPLPPGSVWSLSPPLTSAGESVDPGRLQLNLSLSLAALTMGSVLSLELLLSLASPCVVKVWRLA